MAVALAGMNMQTDKNSDCEASYITSYDQLNIILVSSSYFAAYLLFSKYFLIG